MKRTFGSCTILFLGLAAMPDDCCRRRGARPGLDGVWFADVTPADCGSFLIIPGAPTFRGLYMFGHDGSLTNEAAFPAASSRPLILSAVPAWAPGDIPKAQMLHGHVPILPI